METIWWSQSNLITLLIIKIQVLEAKSFWPKTKHLCIYSVIFLIEAIVGVHCFAWILCLMVLCIHLCHWDRFNFRMFQKCLFTNQTLAVRNHHELLCFLSVAQLYPQSIDILSILVQRHSLASPGLVLVIDKKSASLGCDLLVPSYLRQMDNKQIFKVHPVH